MTGSLHVVVGAGPVGSTLAGRLVEAGHRVRVVTRSGRSPTGVDAEALALDANDRAALEAVARGAEVLYNCASPGTYTQWERAWPPLSAAILHAAQSVDAVLVTMSNLYGYGPVDGPITRDLPLRPSDRKGALRARMWRDALAAHEAGRVRATEARASDFVGAAATPQASLLARYASSTLRGRTAAVFADPDQPHAWTEIDDVARTLAALGADGQAWGSPWLVPTNAPVSVRTALRELGTAVGAGEPRLRVVPRRLLAAGGVAIPLLREVMGILYQFDRPFVVDSTDTTTAFGIEPTPWSEVVARSAEAWRPT